METELKRALLQYSLSITFFLKPSTFSLFRLSCHLPPPLSAHPEAPMSCFFCLGELCSSTILTWGLNYTIHKCTHTHMLYGHTHRSPYSSHEEAQGPNTGQAWVSQGQEHRKPDRCNPCTEADLRTAGWTNKHKHIPAIFRQMPFQ